MIHGADHSPAPWRHAPEILEDDVRLMKLAGCHAMTGGVFAWAALEPTEGAFDFGWLDETMDQLHAHGVFAVLATPSGGEPPRLDAQVTLSWHGRRTRRRMRSRE